MYLSTDSHHPLQRHHDQHVELHHPMMVSQHPADFLSLVSAIYKTHQPFCLMKKAGMADLKPCFRPRRWPRKSHCNDLRVHLTHRVSCAVLWHFILTLRHWRQACGLQTDQSRNCSRLEADSHAFRGLATRRVINLCHLGYVYQTLRSGRTGTDTIVIFEESVVGKSKASRCLIAISTR